MSITYTVSLVSHTSDDLITAREVSKHLSKAAAMRAAKKAAGRGARFVGAQGRCEYRGADACAVVS